MAAPAQRRPDPHAPSRPLPAVERNLRAERARRRARIEHQRERRRARLHFFVLILALLAATAILSLTILDQLRSLFGV